MYIQTVPTLIAFFGRGPDYLKIALKSAARFNSQVVLIGDEANRGFWKDHWDSSRIRLEKFDEFKRSYAKMSSYPEFYEMAFWRRPFAVEQWMKSEGIDQVFLLDGDVVTFADYAHDVVPVLPSECCAALMMLQDQDSFAWATSLHFSYWTLDALTDFTSFCIEAYRDPGIRSKLEAKYRWHVENQQPGGICEMTLLYLWRERHANRIWNLAKVWNEMVGDLSIVTSANYVEHEYEMRGGFKDFTFKGAVPYGFNRILGREIRFLCVHCQGNSKRLMKFLYGRGLRRFYARLYDLDRLVDTATVRARSALKAALRPLGTRVAKLLLKEGPP